MKITNNKFMINNYPVSDLAKQYQTPLMIFDEYVLNGQINLFKENFSGQVVYASKAFICPYIIKKCQEYGLYIDATSMGDLYILKESGFPMHHILFHGNNKSIDELKYAIAEGVIIVVDNLGELTILASLTNQKVLTMFRFNPGIDAHTHYFIQTSLLSSKFGESIFDEIVIEKVMKLYFENQHLQLLGFHSHIGSQITDVSAFIKNATVMMDFTKHINEIYQTNIKMLNVGGGFGIRYTDENVNLKDMIIKLNRHISEYQKTINLPLEKVFIEPGRSIVGPSAVTVYKMGYLKETFGKKRYLFIDGGMTDNIRPALYQAKYQCFNADAIGGEQIVCDIAGKCCESGDIIIQDVLVNYQKEGYLVVTNTGAYCYSMSSNYNSATKMAVITVGDEVKEIIKRESLSDLMNNFHKEF